MNNDLFGEYEVHSKVDKDVIDKYKNRVPAELISIWKEYGFGTIFNGGLKIINPEDYQLVVNMSYFRSEIAIPLMVTGFGDIITWEENEYVSIIKYKNGVFDIMLKGFKHFFNCLQDDYFMEKYFELNKYEDAVKKYGKLYYDECFGYVPLLGLGGSEKVENLKKVKIREHIELITQLIGRIE